MPLLSAADTTGWFARPIWQKPEKRSWFLNSGIFLEAPLPADMSALVGVVEYSDCPAEAREIARVGDAFRVDYETLARLDPVSRRLLEQKYFDRITTRDLARQMKLTEKAVERRLARARHRLERILHSRRPRP